MLRLSLLCLLWLFLPAPHADAEGYFTLTTDRVNLRDGPGLNQKVVSRLNSGQLLLEIQRQGQWSEVFLYSPSDAHLRGWIFNAFLQQSKPGQGHSDRSYQLDALVSEPVCPERVMIGVGSLCYVDVSFVFTDVKVDKRKVDVSCWADFVYPGGSSISPMKSHSKQTYHLYDGRAEGVIRLNAGLQRHVKAKGFNVAYYHCNLR